MRVAGTEAAGWLWVAVFTIFLIATGLALAGCSGETGGSGTQDADATPAMRPHGNDDHATTVEEREVQIKMVANDSGESLEIDKLEPGQAHGSIICEAGIKTGKVRSCAYTPVKGFSGKDEFSYVVKDASGKTVCEGKARQLARATST